MMLLLSDLPIVDLVRISFSTMEHLARTTKEVSMVISFRTNRATCSMDTRGELDLLKEVSLLRSGMRRMDKALLEEVYSQPMLLVNYVRTSAITSFIAILDAFCGKGTGDHVFVLRVRSQMGMTQVLLLVQHHPLTEVVAEGAEVLLILPVHLSIQTILLIRIYRKEVVVVVEAVEALAAIPGMEMVTVATCMMMVKAETDLLPVALVTLVEVPEVTDHSNVIEHALGPAAIENAS